MALTTQEIQQAYVTFFSRPADVAGLNFWAQYPGDLSGLYATFAQSPEYASAFDNLSNGEKVQLVYQNQFGRSAEAEGLNYWTLQLDNGAVTVANLALAVGAGAQGSDGTTLANRVTAATAFTAELDTSAEILGYSGDSANIAAKAWLGGVTDDASLAAAIEPTALATNVASVVAVGEDANAETGQTFTLTKSVDAVTGTAGNDTIVAGDDGGSASLSAGDQINGGGGTDTIKIFNAAGALGSANFASTSISNVENVEATMLTTNVINVSGNTDVKKVTLVNGADGVVTLNLAQTAGLSGAINTASAATFTFTGATGSTDSAMLNLAAADLTTTGASGVTIANVETLNVAATGTSKLGTTTLAQTTKLVISGDGAVSTTLAGTLAKTIDGSTSTGNLTIDNKAAAAAIQSIKTGTGNDTYTTKYADLTADDAIEMGTGTDALHFSDAATFNSTTTAALLTKVTGVEQLGTVNALLTVDGDNVSQTNFYTNGAAGDFALTDVAEGSTATYGAGAILANAIGMKLGANTLNLALEGSKTAAAVVTNGTTVTGSSTINVSSTGTDGVANNTLTLAAADNQNVIVTGSQNMTLVATNSGTTTGFNINASAFTGKFTVTGTSDADIIIGGSGNDTFNGLASTALGGVDSYTGNAGADKFSFVSTDVDTTAGIVTHIVTDFTTGSDTFAFVSAAAGSATNYVEATVAASTLTALLTAAGTALDGTVDYYVGMVGTDAYLVTDNNGVGYTDVVQLVGVDFAGIAATDIVA